MTSNIHILKPEEAQEDEELNCPETKANVISRFTYSWLNPLLKLGTKRPLENSDFGKPWAAIEATTFGSNFEAEWQDQLDDGKPPSISNILWKLLSFEFILVGGMRFIADMMTVFSPFLIKLIITYVSQSSPSDPNIGYYYAVGLFLLQESSSIISNRFFQIVTTRSVIVRGALYSIIYKKATKLSSLSRQDFNGGKVTNVISTDVNRIEQFLVTVTSSWTAPLQVLAIIALLISQLGPSALVGVGLLILLGPFQKILMGYLFALRKQVAPIADSRIKSTEEILTGIRVIKFFTWEEPYLEHLQSLRIQELALILKRSLIQAFVMMIAFSVPVVASSLTFVVYGLTRELNAAVVFASLSWFNQLRFPLMILPRVLAGFADFKIGASRITSLLLAEEVQDTIEHVLDPDFGIVLKDATFKWETREKSSDKVQDFTIKDLNMKIKKGSLCAIIGPVGSGKSTILNSLVGETKKVSGSMAVSGTIGYCPQQAWIQNGTLKENILFGRSYDEQKFANTIHCCALEHDLEILPDAELTEIGEKGINLSGGQKQRINLARLVYFDSDVVLLDDPLSAVDQHVGKFLFDECILGGPLSTKTRLLVTHQLHILPKCDYIYVLSKDGQISEHGTFADLISTGLDFSNLIQNYKGQDEEGRGENLEKEMEKPAPEAAKTFSPILKKGREMMQKEERTTGSVSRRVWFTYFNAAGGNFFIVSCFCIVTLIQCITVANNYWLVVWTNNSIQSLSQIDYVLIYLGLSVALAIVSYGFGVFMGYSGVRAGRNLHEDAIRRIVRAPTSFYDSTPLGRIINRFSKDLDVIDNILMDSFRMFLNTLFSTIATFLLIIVATPWFVLPLVPVCFIYFHVLNVYRANSRELKRIDSIARSPLFALLGETLAGISTIRAYGEVDRFVKETDARIENSISPSYYQFSAIRWLSFRFEFLGSLLLFFAALFGVIGRDKGNISPAMLGLSLSYALQVTMALNWCARQFTETEIGMNCVERLYHYGHEIEVEAAPIVENNRPDKPWPLQGKIEFKKVEMKYLPELPSVLKRISFTLEPQTKTGIVGRTGSGKSSLIQAVFRFIEICNGVIEIDGVDISKIGLKDLRSKIAIIPQDPILFSGSIRRNLDPFSVYQDSLLWDPLERAQLKSKITLIGGLEGIIAEGGTGLSLGEKQLLCLARALLASCKIIFLDEVTSNVDYDSDAKIQKIIREDFKECTVVTIAHRINTILDYDKILVMDQGEVAEFDKPSILLDNKSSIFYSLYHQHS